MITFDTIVGFTEATKPSLKAHLWKIVPLKYWCMEKAHEKMFCFVLFSCWFDLKNVCDLKNGTESLRITCNLSTVL